MRQKLILWLGKLFAATLFYPAYWLGSLFVETWMNPPPVGNTWAFFTFFVSLGVGFGAIAGGIGTLVALVSFPFKWWRESRREWRAAKFFDMAGDENAKFLAGVFTLSVFACGFFGPVIEERSLTTLLALASLPTVLQLIELMRQPQTPTGTLPAIVSDG